MQTSKQNVLIIGIGGYVVAIDPSTGTEIWRTKLKSPLLESSVFVTVFQSGSRVFAGFSGELFCLDGATGNVLWQNKLKGLGMGLVSFPCTPEAAFIAAVQAQQASTA